MNVQEARFRNAVADNASEQFLLDRGSLVQRTASVATAAAAEAEDVDRQGRLPPAPRQRRRRPRTSIGRRAPRKPPSTRRASNGFWAPKSRTASAATARRSST